MYKNDRVAIDEVVVNNRINTGIESIGVTNTDFNVKPLSVLILIAIIVIIAIIMINYIV